MYDRFYIEQKHVNINSKLLFKDVHAHMVERLERVMEINMNNDNIRFNVFNLIRLFADKLKDDGRIDRYRIIINEKNNPQEFLVNDGLMAIDFEYKEKGCFNTTALNYKLLRKYKNGNDETIANLKRVRVKTCHPNP